MKFKFYKSGLLILFIACISSIHAQESITDSLEKLLKTTDNKQSELNILTSLTKEYSQQSLEKTVLYGEKALTLARKLSDVTKEVEIIQYIGDAYNFQNKFKEAEDNYNNAFKIAETNKLFAQAAKLINALGLNNYYAGKYDEAIVMYQKALDYSHKNKIDKELGNALFNMGQAFRKKGNDSLAFENYNKAVQIFEKIDFARGLGKTYNALGIMHIESSNYQKAVEYYEKALKYREAEGDVKGIAILHNNVGNVLFRWGKYEKAITSYQKALKTFEKIGSQEGIARCANNIGLVYENLPRGEQYQQNLPYYQQALEYHQRALKIWETFGKEYEIVNSYNNLGNVNSRMTCDKLATKYGADWEFQVSPERLSAISREFQTATELYKKSLAISEKIGDKKGMTHSLLNLGKLYNYSGKYNLALTNLNRALNIKLGSDYEECVAYYELGKTYMNLKNIELSLDYLNKSLLIAQKKGLAQISKNIYLAISNAYKVSGRFDKSLEAYKTYIRIQDSLVNENNMKQIAEIQTQYETEKKEQQIQLLNKDAKLKDIEIKQKNAAMFIFIGGFILILIITLLLIKQNKERKKANIELATKNELITHQKKEITDSIHYASRIQQAVMLFESHLKTYLPDSFILFKPRDIVSGDFFWVAEKKGKIIVVAADCTGHGVPGAFMSMLGMSMLSNITAENDEMHADEILNVLRERIIESLHQKGVAGENKDGMDIVLYILDPVSMTLEFAGANNPLCIVRNGELLEYKADKMPIGIHERANQPFTLHQISLQKGDMLYSYSDGYHDQFGGENNKKFMSSNLKKLLVKISNDDPETQYQILDNTITEWMKETSQIDDMLVIGVRV